MGNVSSTQKFGSPGTQFNNSYNRNGQWFLGTYYHLFPLNGSQSFFLERLSNICAMIFWSLTTGKLSCKPHVRQGLGKPWTDFLNTNVYKNMKENSCHRTGDVSNSLSSVAIKLGRCESLEEVHIQGTILTSWRRKGKRVIVKRFITISHATRQSIFWHQCTSLG